VAELSLSPVEGLPEVGPGDDIAQLVIDALAKRGQALEGGDILVVAQKIVSKSEGRLRDLATVTPGKDARRIAEEHGPEADPRLIQVILDETVRVVRSERVLIVETRHGYVCANAGVDHSNVPGLDMVTLLPVDPDSSAESLRARLREIGRVEVGVIVSDTFGRAWRIGIENVALGVAGLPAVIDYRGQLDDFDQELTATVVAVADELAAAAELVMGKTARIPAVVIRGYHPEALPGLGKDLIRPAELDLFR
jgi:coenzyme F420-0:L-glutamate ligase/coenzyme F420-1:gamma-L-glutamate ligase